MEQLEDRRLLAVVADPMLAASEGEQAALTSYGDPAIEAAAWKADLDARRITAEQAVVGELTAAATVNGEGEAGDFGVTIESNSNGQFTLRRGNDNKWLLYPNADTSYLSVNIDGQVFTNEEFGSGLTAISSSGTSWVYAPVAGVQITQILTIEGDSVKCEVIAENVNGNPHSVRVRYLFDTQVDDNDGAPLYNGSQHYVSEVQFAPPTFTEWRSWRRPDDQSVVGVGLLDHSFTTEVVFAHWPAAFDEPWDYAADPNQPFYTSGYVSSPASDSCVLVYMDVGTLLPGESGTVQTWYGAGEPAVQNLRDRLIAAMTDLVGAINRYQQAAISVVGTADADLAKHIADDASLTNQAIDFGLDLLAGDGAYIVGKLATNPSGPAAQWVLEKMFTRFQVYNVLLEPGLVWISGHLDDWIHLGEVDFDQSRAGIAQDIIDYLSAPSRLGGIVSSTQQLVQDFTNRLPETLDDPALVEAIIGELGALADNIETHIPRPDRVKEGPVYWNAPGTSFSAELGPLNPLLLGQISSASGELAWADGLLDTVGTITTVRRVICGGWTVGGGAIKVIATATAVGAPISQAAYWSGVGVCSAASTANGLVDLGASAYGLWQQYENMSDLRTDVQLVHDFGSAIADNVLTVLGTGATYSTEVSVGNFDAAEVSVGWFEDFGQGSGTITVTNEGTGDAAVRGALYVYRKNDDRYEELVVPPVANSGGDLLLAAGESRQLSFQFEVPAGGLLRADKYFAQVYVLGSGGVQVDGDYFRACRPSGCFLDDVWETVTSGELAAGDTHQTNVQVDDQAVAAEFTLGYQGSDMDLHLYDASGRHVGFNYESGTIDLEVPGSSYSGAASFPESISVPTTEGSAFRLEVVGVDTHGREDFFVLQTQVMSRQATLNAGLDQVAVEGWPGRTATGRFTLAELGGQVGISGLAISVSELTSFLGDTLQPDVVNLELPATSIAAGGGIEVAVDVELPADSFGQYTGQVEIVSDQGSLTLPIAATALGAPWRNPINPYDINNIDGVTSLDVLEMIHWINTHPGDLTLPERPLPPHLFYDVDGNGQCTSLDVLEVITLINKQLNIAGGEAESAAAVPIAVASSPGDLALVVGAEAIWTTRDVTADDTANALSTRGAASDTPTPLDSACYPTDETADAEQPARPAARSENDTALDGRNLLFAHPERLLPDAWADDELALF